MAQLGAAEGPTHVRSADLSRLGGGGLAFFCSQTDINPAAMNWGLYCGHLAPREPIVKPARVFGRFLFLSEAVPDLWDVWE